jgi:hypothetical protein
MILGAGCAVVSVLQVLVKTQNEIAQKTRDFDHNGTEFFAVRTNP